MQNERYEIKLPEFDLVGYSSDVTTTSSRETVDLIQERNGGDWAVHAWNPQTRTPMAVIGSGFETGQRLTTDVVAEATARTVLDQNRDALGVDGVDLRFVRAGRGLGKVGVHFQQTYNEIPVMNTQANAMFTEEGRVYSMGAEVYRGIDLDTSPTIPASVAQEIARQDVPFNPSTDEVLEGAELLILPYPTSVKTVEHHLVWQVRVVTQDPLGEWVTHVDAHTGDIVYRYNDIHFLDFSGGGDTSAQDVTYCDGEVVGPIAFADVTISGLGSDTTDEDGDWIVPFGSTGNGTLATQFFGPYCNVNVWGATPDAQIIEVIDAGTPYQISWDDANARQDERDVFTGVSDIHIFMETVDPGYSYWNNRITANVGVPGSCNAYWNGTINFYNAGGGCANTGEIEGVVQHEFGHGVQNSLLGSQGGQGLGEGNSDVLANLLTQESVIGRGFSSCNNGIRDSNNNLMYPDDVIGHSVHNAGRVIAGFHWDFMLLMQDIYGDEEGARKAAEIWHFARKVGVPFTQPLQVLRSFEADDDDGDLDNGTPHYDLLCEAATNHGFSCPVVTEGIFITHTPVPDQTSPGDVTLQATIESTQSPVNTATIRYTVDGGPEQTAPMSLVSGMLYEGDIPGLASPDIVEYYIEVEANDGTVKTAPNFAPIQIYGFDMAIEYDDTESASGWTVNPDGTDDASSTEMWENVDPVGTLIQPEDDTTPDPGVKCWVTGQAPPGGFPSSGALIDATTTLQSPVYDVTGATTAIVRYNKWYRNDGGPNPDEDVWIVLARNNGGSWLELENTGHNTNGWETFTADLVAFFGEPVGEVQFRFIGSDLGEISIVDCAIDDVRILGEQDVVDVPDLDDAAQTPRYALLGSRPNPAFGRAQIAFQVPADSPVDIRVFDVTGREIRTLVDDDFGAGVHQVEWDGQDGRGNAVPSGVYFYRMDTPEYQATQQLILNR